MNLLSELSVYVLVVTEMEMQCKPNKPAVERRLIKSLLQDCFIVELTPQIKTEAIKVRRSTRTTLIDSIIAASAQIMGQPFVTGDAFERVAQSNLIFSPPR